MLQRISEITRYKAPGTGSGGRKAWSLLFLIWFVDRLNDRMVFISLYAFLPQFKPWSRRPGAYTEPRQDSGTQWLPNPCPPAPDLFSPSSPTQTSSAYGQGPEGCWSAAAPASSTFRVSTWVQLRTMLWASKQPCLPSLSPPVAK